MIDKNDPRLTDFVLGELDAEQHTAIESQLRRDPELASAVNELSQTLDLIRMVYQFEPELTLDADRRSELAGVETNRQPINQDDQNERDRIGLNQKTDIEAVSKSKNHRWSSFGLAALAVCLSGLVIGGSIWYTNFKPSSRLAVRLFGDKIATKDDEQANSIGMDSDFPSDELGVLADFDADFHEAIPLSNEFEPSEDLDLRFFQGTFTASDQWGERSGSSSFEMDITGRFQTLGREELGSESSDAIEGKESVADPMQRTDELDLSIAEAESSNSRFSEAMRQERGGSPGSLGGMGDLDGRGLGRMSGGMGGDGMGGGGMGGGIGGLGAPDWKVVSLASDPDIAEPFSVVHGESIPPLEPRVDPSGTREIELRPLPANDRLDQSVKIVQDNSTGAITAFGGKAEVEEVHRLIQEVSGQHGRRAEDLKSSPIQTQVQLGQDDVKAETRSANTWQRVKAIPNTSRLMIGEDDELPMRGMQVNVQIDGFRARVLIDCFYYNDRDQPLEGNYKLRLPDDASLYYFAFGESAYQYEPKLDWDTADWSRQEFQDDETEFVSFQPDDIRQQRAENWINCREARMVPREKAAFAYNHTVRRKVDPALVEWSGAGVFNARVFPLASRKLHRIVMGYDVNLVRSGNSWTYEMDLPEQTGACRVDINVQEIDGVQVTVQPNVDPRNADDKQRVEKKSARYARHSWSNPKAKSIRISIDQSQDVVLTDSNALQGDFWGLQLTPELPVAAVTGNSQAIFLLDTSLSSNPDRFNVWLKLLRATLENNRDSLTQFNVLFFDVGSAYWRDGYVANTPENMEALLKDCEQITLEGATDLYGAFEKVANSTWISGETKTGPDLFLLSDGAVNWGETNLRLIQSQIRDHQLGTLFAYQTGLTGTAIANLRFLANQSGGAVFSVATEDEIKTASTAHRNRPWRLATIEAEGTRDVLTAGRVEWVYPGQALTIVGRGELTGDLKINLTQGDNTKTVLVHPTKLKSELASRLYGQIAVGQLESLGTQLFDISAAYARHFRVTGDTCSLLMLETEADYERFDIKPEEDLFVIKSKNAGQLVSETLQTLADGIANPKLQMLAWLQRLESMPGMQFKVSTALQLALGEIKFEAISQPLDCDPRTLNSAPESYLHELAKQELNYEIIELESKRRAAKSVDEAIKVWSCLIERNPGDLVIARDVAFSAMELDRPAQAYPLLLAIAKARPYDASVYPAIGQCLVRLKKADMAIVFYEIALAASFENRNEDFKRIVAADYLHLLRQVTQGGLKTSIPDYVNARCESLKKLLGFETADLLVTMMWNTDQTDVDLHVLEPSGQECCYELKDTRIGGHITQDITTGFGPEMYRLSDAMSGKYEVAVKLFRNNQNRTSLRNKIHLTIYQGYGTAEERLLTKTIQLKTVGEKEPVLTIGVD